MTETCTATKNDGDPCTYQPSYEDGKCGIHSEHSGDVGRPSEVAEYEDDLLVGARQGMNMQGLARLAGVAEKNLYEYLKKDENEEFRKSLNRARAQGELKHLQSVNDRGSQFVLERSFGYVKTEKRELEHSGDAGIVIHTEALDNDDGD